MGARLFEHVLHNPAFAGGGEKDFVHKLLAGVREKRVERAHHVSRGDREPGSGIRKVDEAFERIAEVANALHVMAKRMGFRSSTHNQNITGTHAAIEAPIKHRPIDQASQAERDYHQYPGNYYNSAGNIVGVHKVKRSGEQKPSRQAGLKGEALFVQVSAQARRSI